MSNPLELSIPRSSRSRSGSWSESAMLLSLSPLFRSLNYLLRAAGKLAEEHDSPKIGHYLANELKSLPEYIHKMVENFFVSGNFRVMHNREDKIRLGYEIFTATNLCDQLTETFQHLARQIQIRDGEKDDDYVVNGLFDSFTTLSIMNDHVKDISRLVFSEMTPQDRLKTSSVVVVKTHDKFLRQLDLARTSNTLMVMLFHLRSYESYNKALLKFVELSEQYDYDHGEDSVKFLAVGMQVSARVLKVEHYPTVVVMKGDKEVGRVSIVETGLLPAVFTGLKVILDDCLEDDDDDDAKGEYYGLGVIFWKAEEHHCLENDVVFDSNSDSDSD